MARRWVLLGLSVSAVVVALLSSHVLADEGAWPGTVTLFNPQNGYIINGYWTLKADATHPSGIARVEFYRDGDVLIGEDAIGPFRANWQTITDCSGEVPHTLFARAVANDGTSGDSAAVSITVDNTTFTDVPCTHFAWRFVQALFRNGFTAGYPDGTYRPDASVPRGEMAVFVARGADQFLVDLSGYIPPPCGSEHFADLTCDHAQYKFVEYIAAKGIASGFPDGAFKPDALLSRGQMAVFLARLRTIEDSDLAGYTPPACGSESFTDISCDAGAFKFVEYIAGKGIASGYPDGAFRPAALVTRGQMAVFLTRAANLQF